MGYIKHHAIIVTGWKGEALEDAHKRAKAVFGDMVSPLVKSATNGYISFFIAPDGSKEGWEQSNTSDRERESFINWLEDYMRDDKAGCLSYVELFYGEDNGEADIVKHN